MICRLCLKDTVDLIYMFEGSDDNDKAHEPNYKQRAMAAIVGKYFWFEPKYDDTISTSICKVCCLKLIEFDQFYNQIEEAQHQYQEQLMNDSIGLTQTYLNENEGSEGSENICKQEDISFESFHIIEDSLETLMVHNLEADKFNNVESEQIKRKRGRPKKLVNTKTQRILSTITKNNGETKNMKIDAEIAKYMTLHCELCNIEVKKFASLKYHMRTKHNVLGYFICCGKKFMKRILLLEHIRKHLNISSYKCHICNKVFAKQQTYHKHYQTKHQKDQNKINDCSQCPKKVIRKNLLEQHETHAHIDRSTTCKTCGKRLKELMTPNKSNEHCDGTMCGVCAKVIRGAAAFQRHRLEHMGIILPKIQCEDCGSWHKDNKTMNKYTKNHVQSNEKPMCGISKKPSSNQTVPLNHMQNVEGRTTTYPCNKCNKTFENEIYLREHMADHANEILHKCPHCPKTFNSNGNMHLHRKKVHPKEFEELRKLRQQNSHFQINAALPKMSYIPSAIKTLNSI